MSSVSVASKDLDDELRKSCAPAFVTPRLLWLEALVVWAGFGALYWLTRSRSLADWDSVNFLFSLNCFDISRHQPHPPGYPLYVWLGQLLCALGFGAKETLQAISAFGGGLFVAAWYAQTSLRFGRAIALCTAAALGLLPATWIASLQVLTDPLAVGVFAACLLLLLLHDRSGRRRWLLAACLAAAASTGIRPQFGPVAVVALAAHLALRRANIRLWVLAVGVFAAGCLAWLLPLMWSQAALHPQPDNSGWAAYLRNVETQWKWCLASPGVNALGGTGGWDYFQNRLREHFETLVPRGLGVFRGEGGWASWACGVLWLAGMVLACLPARWRDGRYRRFWRDHLPWAATLIALNFIMVPPMRRYYLHVIPLLAAPAAIGWCALGRRGWLGGAVLAGGFAAVSLPLAAECCRDLGPMERTTAASVEIDRSAPKSPPIVWAVSEAGRHFHWYAPQLNRVSPSLELFGRARRGEIIIYTDSTYWMTQSGAKGFRYDCVFVAVGTTMINEQGARSQLFRLVPIAPNDH